MSEPVAAATSLAWFATVGSTFGCLLPYLLNDLALPPAAPRLAGRPGPGRGADDQRPAGPGGELVGGLLQGQRVAPWPAAAPPVLVVRGFYRHVRNPIFSGFVIILATGPAPMLFGTVGLLEYAAAAWVVGAAAVPLLQGAGADPQVR